MSKHKTLQVSVITIPLKTEIWQEDVLNKRMELCRDVYNTMLGKRLKDLHKIEKLPEYVKAITEIKRVYSLKDPKEIDKEKMSASFKNATETKNNILEEWGFTEFGFNKIANNEAKYYKENIPAITALHSIANPMWAAFDRYFYGDGKMVHFKKYDSMNSLASNGKSGIRLVNSAGKTVFHRHGKEKLTLLCGTRGNRVLMIPLIIDPQNKYMAEMLDRDIRIIRIVRKKVKGRYKYSVQLTVDGTPAVKKNAAGEPIHPINEGALGIYIDTRYITIANKEGIRTIDLRHNDEMEDKITSLQVYADKSRRISNPENYNEDGTIKHGLVKNGQHVALIWNNSNGYKKAVNEIANLKRKAAENRKIRSNIIANEILSLGNHIVVNDFSFREAQMRKITDEYSTSGRRLPKKRNGKEIEQNAPGQILAILDKKLVSAGFEMINRKKIEIDKTMEDYRQYYAKKLYNEASNNMKTHT